VRANDDPKVPVAEYHRRYFVFFRMPPHAFLEIKPEATVEGLEKVIGTNSLHHTYALVVDMMRCSELLVGGKEAQRHPEISELSVLISVCLVLSSWVTGHLDCDKVCNLFTYSYGDRAKLARDNRVPIATITTSHEIS
jgi:hypothetical protein